MRRVINLAAFVLMLSACVMWAQTATNESDESIFAAKAQELTTGKDSRIDKVQAIYTFVQTEVAQAKTQYG